MTLLDNIKTFLNKNTKALGNSIGGIVTRNYAEPAKFNPTVQLQGITYKAIDKIGQSVSVYQPVLLKRDGKSAVSHPVLTLHSKPNENQTASYFLHMWAMLDEIYGETFWYLARGETTKRVKEIFLLPPDRVELKIDKATGDVIGYVLHKTDGEQVPLTTDEVVHEKRPNPFNEYRGMSVLERAATYVDTEINTSQFTLNYIKNSASPSGIVSLPDMDRDTFNQFAMKWREGYEGPQNAGKTAFIRGEQAQFQAVGATLKDIDQKVTRDMAKDDVLMMFDVPKGLLGASSDKGLGRNDTESLEYIFAKHKLEPMMRRLDNVYSEIAKSYVRDGTVTISHESVIPEDKEYKLKVQSRGVNVWLTVNEIREQYALDPLPDGDKLMLNNTVPTYEPQKKLKVVKKKTLTKADKARKEKEVNDNFRQEVENLSGIYAEKLKTAIVEFAQKQSKKVIDKIDASSKAYEEWTFEIKEESEEMALLLLPILLELIQAEAEDVTHYITGIPFELTPQQEAIMKNRVLEISGKYNEETAKKLEQTITNAVNEGKSLAKMTKEVEEIYSDAKGYRAERIARTESLRTANETAEEVYRQNGYERVRWYANYSACEFCQTKDGDIKVIGGTFEQVGGTVSGANGGEMTITYRDIDTPPLHPNCACSLIPVE